MTEDAHRTDADHRTDDDDHRTDAASAIDRRLDSVVASAADAGIPLARSAVETAPDSWYGRLLVACADAGPASVDADASAPAAAAIELFRGYCRLRSELLGAVAAGEDRQSAGEDPTAPLLAGDALFSLAYSTLADVEHPATHVCFATLARTSRTIVESFAATDGRRYVSLADHRDLLDGTAGALGRGAAVVGAILGGVEGDRREVFATLGRGLGVARAGRRTPDGAGNLFHPSLDASDDALQRHVTRRLAEADRARREVAGSMDARPLRPLFDAVAESSE